MNSFLGMVPTGLKTLFVCMPILLIPKCSLHRTMKWHNVLLYLVAWQLIHLNFYTADELICVGTQSLKWKNAECIS